ncbi:uncharacterized protein ELE39_000581 [Cryptosporidium sp. chipmunk genotype I]|uniref:uncharacterized protein n=1 Tax=Cryptosporidium sp. chipmunk genotype I TaxID=1280935 RepID=UPI00351A90E8|nr:hypothetical protein ELE39_000581 [Cryptosporidium sp. chipmunk genotype I]
MRLKNLCIFSIFILLITTVNNKCFASNVGFNSLISASYVQQNQQRTAALAAYKKKINDSNKKIFKLKRTLYRILQIQDSNQSGLTFNSNSKTTRASDRHQDSIPAIKLSDNISNTSDSDEIEKKLAEVVVSLLDEQTKFVNLLLKRIVIFWNPNFNFGVDISSKEAIERGFLDMLGLGNKQIWSGSTYGGKLARAIDSENRVQESISKLIGLTELYRYSMVYNYIHIIGSIYRHTKNFERTVRSRLRLFKSMRERLISTRDSLALLLNVDLPDDVDLPYPVSPPCYLNVGENCDEEMYNQILNEIAFFKEVQDENKELSIRIRNGSCGIHEVTGCTSCEIKKVRVSLIDWAFNDIQIDLLRLERDLKLCKETIKQNNGGEEPSISRLNGGVEGFVLSPGGSLHDSEEYVSEFDDQDNYQEEAELTSNASDGFESGARPTGALTRRGRTCESTEIKRYKRRSFQKASKRTSKRRYLKTRRTKMKRRLKNFEIDSITGNNNCGDGSNMNNFQNDGKQATDFKSGDSSFSSIKGDSIVRKGSVLGGNHKKTTEINGPGIYSPFSSFSDNSTNFTDSESESEMDIGSPLNSDTHVSTKTSEFPSSATRQSNGAPETKRGLSSNEPFQSPEAEVAHSLSNTQISKRRRNKRR